MIDLEDDVNLSVDLANLNNEAAVDAKPRKLSRLRKANKAEHQVESPEVTDTAAPEPEEDEELSEIACEEDQPAEVQNEGEEDVANEDENEENYWDEEDDLENYLKTKFENGDASSDDEDSQDRRANMPEAGDEEAGAPREVGNNPEDINAETQRILREAATRDRLGKGHKIEIKPLNSIVEKLLARRAEAIARAPKPVVNTAPSFDDIFAEAEEQIAAVPAATAPKLQNPQADADGNMTADAAEQQAEAADIAEVEDDLDLVIASDDDIEDEVLADLPESNQKKKKNLMEQVGYRPVQDSIDPYADDGFEDEILVEDRLDSDEESDDDSQHSWEAKPADMEQAGDDEVNDDDNAAESSQKDDADEEEEDGSEVENEEDDDASELENEEEEEEKPESANGGDTAGPSKEVKDAIAALLASDGVPKTKTDKLKERLKKVFLDTEAELSDEEGGPGNVSDDEDEDVDDQGELQGLIANIAETGIDASMRESLHRQWEQQKDVKDIQKILRGLEQGFRKRRHGFEDDDDELDGRRRRARFGDDDDDALMPASGWLAAALAGDKLQGGDEEEEDVEVLLKAQRQRLLAGSQEHQLGGYGGSDPGIMPMDEDSQQVLNLLARSASEPQPLACPAPQSRLAAQLVNLNGAGGQKHGHNGKRVASFLGRVPSATRNVSNSGFGGAGGRSFIFGRGENSNPGPTTGGEGETAKGPVDFTNLKQMVGLPPKAADNKKKKGKKPSSLVSRLAKGGSGSLSKSGSQASQELETVNAVCQQVVLGARNRA